MSKVTFDGSNKLIIINSGVTEIDVKDDIYLPWKQWVIDSGSTYLAAFRTFGGDQTTYSQTAPTYYFLINEWQVKAENVFVEIKENLYSDDYDNPFIITNSSVIVKNSDIPRIDSINNQLTGITSDLVIINSELTGMTETIDNMNFDIKLILGLSQNNYRLFDHVYDGNKSLLSVVIKLFNTKSDCDAGINEFAQYQMTAVYDGDGLLTDYKVVKI